MTNYFTGSMMMLLLAGAATLAFYVPDAFGALGAIAVGSAAVGYLALMEHRFSPGRQAVFNSAYLAGFVTLTSWGAGDAWAGGAGLPPAAVLIAIVAAEVSLVIYILNRFCRLSPSASFCLGYFIIDNVNFFFLVPISPALLILPYANTLMYWGGVPLALLAYYFMVFGLSNIFLIKVVRTRKLVASRIIVCIVFTGTALGLNSFKVNHPPRLSETALFRRINLVHMETSLPRKDLRPVQQLIKSAPPNVFLITPQGFLQQNPDKFPPALQRQLTAQNKKLLLGVNRYVSEKNYHVAAYYLTPQGIKFRHRQSLPFPGVNPARGAVPPTRSAPKTYPVLEVARVMPLIGFDIMLPLRNYRHALPDFYAVMGTMENYNEATKKIMRVLTQALAATHHRPVFSTIIKGQSAIINSTGQIKALVSRPKKKFSIVSYVR